MASEAKVNTVVRHNTLIEGEYNLTLEELRIWAMIVSEIDKNDTNFKATYRIYPREYIKLSGTKSKSVYADLRSALKRLRDQELRMKIKKTEKPEHWLLASFPVFSTMITTATSMYHLTPS